MTPSNPSNGNPFVLRIMDALGVLHQVAPVNHTHAQSEVSNLTTALANKIDKIATVEEAGFIPIINADGTLAASGTKLNNLMPANYVMSRIVDSEDGSQAEIYCYGNDGTLIKSPFIEWLIGGVSVEMHAANMPHFERAISAPDSTPTEGSDKLVTSGGVYSAIDEARRQVTSLIPTNCFIQQNGVIDLDATIVEPEKMYNLLGRNDTGAAIHIKDLFTTGVPVMFNCQNIVIAEDKQFAVRICNTGDFYYILFDGLLNEL